jgi:hypothetical protein
MCKDIGCDEIHCIIFSVVNFYGTLIPHNRHMLKQHCWCQWGSVFFHCIWVFCITLLILNYMCLKKKGWGGDISLCWGTTHLEDLWRDWGILEHGQCFTYYCHWCCSLRECTTASVREYPESWDYYIVTHKKIRLIPNKNGDVCH